MVEYDGVKFKTLQGACKALGLDYAAVVKWGIKNRLGNDNATLASYIKYNRIISRGLIFDNLDAACKSWGVSVQMIAPYLARGFGLDLSCYMASHGYRANIFDRG